MSTKLTWPITLWGAGSWVLWIVSEKTLPGAEPVGGWSICGFGCGGGSGGGGAGLSSGSTFKKIGVAVVPFARMNGVNACGTSVSVKCSANLVLLSVLVNFSEN